MITIKGNIFSYPSYSNWVQHLAGEEKTSGEVQSAGRIKFTALNHHRMKRIEKSVQLNYELIAAAQNNIQQTWVIITEAWCGDSAQNIPALGKIAEQSAGKIQLKIILRDQNPDWIQKYHTNGSLSIPKLIAFDENGVELFTWGPRPATAQKIFTEWKNYPDGKSWDEFETELHTWYAKDKTQSLQYEFANLLKPYENKNTKPFPDFDSVIFSN